MLQTCSPYVLGNILHFQSDDDVETQGIDALITRIYEGSTGDGFTSSVVVRVQILSAHETKLFPEEQYIIKIFDPFETTTLREAYGLSTTATTTSRQKLADFVLSGAFSEYQQWYMSKIDAESVTNPDVKRLLLSCTTEVPTINADIVAACADMPDVRRELIKHHVMPDWTTGIQEATVYLAILREWCQELLAFEAVSHTSSSHHFPTLAWTGFTNMPICGGGSTPDQGPQLQAVLPLPAVIMELVAGETLSSLHDSKTSGEISEQFLCRDLLPLDDHELIDLLRDTQILSFDMDINGFVHTDLRPDNVMVSRNSTTGRLQIMLIDLGSIMVSKHHEYYDFAFRTLKAQNMLFERFCSLLQGCYFTETAEDLEQALLGGLWQWLSDHPRIVEIRNLLETGRYAYFSTIHETISWRLVMEDIFRKQTDAGATAADTIDALQNARDVLYRNYKSGGSSSWIQQALTEINASMLWDNANDDMLARYQAAQAIALNACKVFFETDDPDSMVPALIPPWAASQAVAQCPVFTRGKRASQNNVQDQSPPQYPVRLLSI